MLSTPRRSELYFNDQWEWIVNQEKDICCVVNANTVLYLDDDEEECRDAIQYLIKVFRGNPEKFYSPYYNHVTPFYYALSRIIYSRHSPLDSIKEELIEQILSLQKYDGSFGDELKTALAVCSLLNCGFDGDNLTSAIDFLIQTQQSNGSWRRIPWYGYHENKATYGSAELTTGFCLEALIRYRDLKLQPTQQPSDVNGFFRLVRSQEWWLYKIAPLLTIAYAETLLLQLPPTNATPTTLTALLAIASVAAYGYLLNDICDIETDQKANKPNAAANLQPWQRLLLCLLFLSIGFAAPLLTHLGTIPLALLTANYLLPTLYSVPPLRLKERGIWGILSDAAGAHLVPTLFVAATVLSQTPDPPRNALIFTGIAAAHAFFVGLRGILLHQLWDRANDLNSGTATFVTQQPPETVQRWIDRFVFPVEILLLSGVALLLCQSTPALTTFFAVYLLLTTVNIKTAPHPFTPSPPKNQNIIPHDLYEVWLPLALSITLAVQNPQFLIFVALTAILFYPSLKVRTMELFHVIKAGFTPVPNPTPSTVKAPRPTATNVAPLTPEMEQQVETPQTTNSIPSAEQFQEQLTQTQTELSASNEQLHQSQVELEQLKIQLNQTQTHLEQSRSQLQRELTASNEQLHQSQVELEQLKIQLNQTQTHLEQSRSQLQRELTASNEQLHQSQVELEQLKIQLNQTQTHLEQSRSQLQRELSASNEQLHQKTTELATLKEDYFQTQAEVENVREQWQTAQTQLQQTQTELERDRTQLQQTQAKLAQLKLQQQQSQSEIQQSQQQLQQTQAKLQISERQQQQMQALLEESQAELSEKTAELTRIKSEQHQARLTEIIRRRL
ncbi:UbiA family prenyltransferase [Laspinema sp. D1]|uniref:UbiA family prenyltransferase n=1 Tax=Laspinema palackyanum TaxID=3231601 RepID=UPI003495D499|nr:UbiA family prenyltransferase [Laspinema sp. D2b]